MERKTTDKDVVIIIRSFDDLDSTEVQIEGYKPDIVAILVSAFMENQDVFQMFKTAVIIKESYDNENVGVKNPSQN